MLALFRQYRPVLRFIFLFLGSYTVLSMLYFWYLSFFVGPPVEPDGITRLVGQQTQSVIRAFGFGGDVAMISGEATLGIWVDGIGVARLVEGCNAMSVMILFCAFILAFARGLQQTIGYILAGMVLIYSVNILRVVFISIALAHFDTYRVLLHDIIFPGLIYGFVLLLWLFWIWMIKRQDHA